MFRDLSWFRDLISMRDEKRREIYPFFLFSVQRFLDLGLDLDFDRVALRPLSLDLDLLSLSDSDLDLLSASSWSGSAVSPTS